MKPMVSIIVPVYNAEDFLERCIDSILAQDYHEFELILVDDGSTDSSGDICDRYARMDSRVVTVHKKNSGVSDTRNLAISMAQGTYLQFVDSDDWLAPNATSMLFQAALGAQADLVIADFYRVVEDRLAQKGDIETTGVMTREEFAGHMMENPADFYYGVLWNKLYRRDVIMAHDLRMDSDISWCEDFMFNLEYIRYAHRFVAVQIPIYYYVKRKGSLVSQGISISRTIKMKLTVFEYYNNFYKHILDEKDYEKSRLQVYRFLVDSAGDGMVPPAIFPGSKKLGEERISVAGHAVQGEGILMDDYRRRKLLEYFAEPIAQRCGLSFNDIRTLVYLEYPHPECSRKELADLIGISRSSLSFSMQKLVSKDYIKVEEVKSEEETPHAEGTESKTIRRLRTSILPEARSVLDELDAAQARYKACIFEGFTEEELEEHRRLENRIKDNIRKILQ